MKHFKDLNPLEKRLFNKIEDLLINTAVSKESYLRTLGVLLNKHKSRNVVTPNPSIRGHGKTMAMKAIYQRLKEKVKQNV